MIISVSRKTDIPAHYSKWFLERINRGKADSYGYMNDICQVSLNPADVDAFVFWSKDFRYFSREVLPFIDDDFEKRFIFQYTITGLNAGFEPVTKAANIEYKVIENFLYLQDKYPNQINWRFDPIIYTNTLGFDYFCSRFRQMIEELSFPRRCFISFCKAYKKNEKNLETNHFTDPDDEEKKRLVNELLIIANGRTEMFSCCNPLLLEIDGISKASCIDGQLISKLFLNNKKEFKKAPTRKGCGCYESKDIGRYGTCKNNCIYCYAA